MTMRGSLSLPEGVAAAEVLKVGSHMKSYGYCAAGIKELLKGSGIAGLITFFMSGLHILSTSMTVWFSAGRAVTQIPLGFSPALVGVGYLLGAVSGVTMLIGLVIAWGGFVPYITLTEPIPDGMGLAQFADMIFVQKVRLIGAGAMGVAALWALLTLTFSRAVLREVKEAVMDAQSDSAPMRTAHRTDADLSMRTLGIVFWVTIAGLLLIFYSFISPEHLPPVQKVLFTVTGVSLAVVSGFLVTAAAAYMSGLVGTSSSPLSGVGILGIVASSLLMYALCCDFGIFDIPNGKRLGAAIARGIFSGQADFQYLYIGIGLGVLLIAFDLLLKRFTQRCSLSPLTVSMGIYLPPVILTPILIGAMLSGFLHRRMRKESGAAAAEEGRGRGTLFASGLIVGEVIVGLLIACVVIYTTAKGGTNAPLSIVDAGFSNIAEGLGLVVFIGLLLYFGKIVRGEKKA